MIVILWWNLQKTSNQSLRNLIGFNVVDQCSEALPLAIIIKSFAPESIGFNVVDQCAEALVIKEISKSIAQESKRFGIKVVDQCAETLPSTVLVAQDSHM